MTLRDRLLDLLAKESAGELKNVFIAFQIKGSQPQAVHNLPTNPRAIAFVSEALPLSHDDMIGILRGRQ